MAKISTGRLALIVASLSSSYLSPLSKSIGLNKVFVSALSTKSYSRMSPPFSITRDSKSSTVTLTPRDEAAQSGLVVLSHGLGDSSEGLLDLAEHLATQKDLSHLKFILPNAPTRPVTMVSISLLDSHAHVCFFFRAFKVSILAVFFTSFYPK